MKISKLLSLTILTGLVILIAPITAQAQVIHRVNVGGPDICEDLGSPIGCDADFSLVALEFANGRITGQWSDRFAGGDGFHAVIDCLVVDGQNAWVSGLITHGSVDDFDLAGFPVWAQVVDNGTSQNDIPDRISFSFILDSTPCTDKPDLGTFAIPQGQVRVE